jgi:hypothetical protein
MNKDDLEKKLENLGRPQLPDLQHQWQLRLSILSAKRSAWAALWLLLAPLLVFASGALYSLLKISVPPYAWLAEYSSQWPLWVRITVFMTTVIVLPSIAVILNLLAIVWIQYDREQKVLNISIRMKTINLIIIIVAGLIALLFIGHSIADYIAGAD